MKGTGQSIALCPGSPPPFSQYPKKSGHDLASLIEIFLIFL